jgi:Glycoside Hydrolase Family 113
MLCAALLSTSTAAASPLAPGAEGWADGAFDAVRGVTVGPIENSLHPSAGYGTERGRAALLEAKAMGATWVALTPFGRVWDLKGGGVDLTFEAPAEENRSDVIRAIEHAHAAGLKVLLVPHLWVETGGWRALIRPENAAGWARWAASYERFLLHWTDVAAATGVEMLSVGVELRSWVTTAHVARFRPILAEVRARYGGLLTYSANWDDVADTLIWNDLDVIGINAFFPLAKKEDASYFDLALGAQDVAVDLERLSREWDKPVLLSEMGYTTRKDPALKPWEWPDGMTNVVIDPHAQALAYRALLAPLVQQRWCAGFFVWRTYADPGDVSQEAEWGFSPRGKDAELVLRDAFIASWAADGRDDFGAFAGLALGDLATNRRYGGHRARTPGIHAWEMSPPLPLVSH